jgi:peptidyl-prolyl cis-trans isomerase C
MTTSASFSKRFILFNLIVLALCLFVFPFFGPKLRADVPSHVIDEELLYREALQLGLDRELTRVPETGASRKVLIEQMRLLLSRPEHEERMSDVEIRKYYQAHRDRFRVPGQISFRQVFFPLNTTTNNHGKWETVLLKLRAGSPSREVSERFSSPHPLGLEFHGASEEFLSRRFGIRFTVGLRRLKLHEWTGPIESPLGHHLIFIEKRFPPSVAPLASVRQTIIAAISKEHADRRLEWAISRLRNSKSKAQ